MPELPDVEGWKRYVNRYARGRRIRSVSAPSPDDLRNTTASGLGRAVSGRRFGDARRHGKWLMAPTDEGPTVVFHFGMSGSLTWTAAPDGLHDHDRVVFGLDGGRLTYRSQRRLGGIWSAGDSDEIDAITGTLGPDAADVDHERLTCLLEGRRGGIKAALMDQQLIAGIGNELSDEILWRARIHPLRPVPDLDDGELDQLHDALTDVVTASMRRGRIPEDDGWLESVRGAEDPRCPRCGGAIERIDAAGRTAYVCQREQTS